MWYSILPWISAVLLSIILYFKFVFSYWKRRNVTYLPPDVPFGNFKEYLLQRLSFREQMTILCQQLKMVNKGKPYAGIYLLTKPVLLTWDPDFIRQITTVDFQYFTARSYHCDEKNEPLTGNLFMLVGEKWRFMRQKLTPTFSSGKMKMMFNTFVACSAEIETILDEHVKSGEPIEVKEMMARFTTDIIGSCAFGIECNSLRDPENIFRKNGKRVFALSLWDVIRGMLAMTMPTLFTLLKLKVNPKETSDFFMDLVKRVVSHREENNIMRDDFLHLLLHLKARGYVDNENEGDNTKKLTIEQVAAQCYLFFLAGFETSSSSLSFFIYRIAQHQDIQDKVRNEINGILKKYEGQLTYEGVMEMTYLRQVIDETLRMNPVSPFLSRTCTARYKVPDSDLVLEKGTSVMFPPIDIHRDPKYFPNPEVFDPDRFSPERKKDIKPFTYMPFGFGPRNCIGKRFGLLQMSVGIVALLKNYRFTVSPRTRTPLKEEPKNLFPAIQGGLWMNVEKL